MSSMKTLILSADIDEYHNSTHNCDHLCSNSMGSYECSCNKGFELGEDEHSCLGKRVFRVHLDLLSDEYVNIISPQTWMNVKTLHMIVITVVSTQMVLMNVVVTCDSGFVLAEDHLSCIGE